ncbi:hypothetical protein ADINL_0400 [Nitrincola lacisaponensis]|uniref:Uncharacterized protein n=1 Tax=Nitrincola lacisaponensis TaxID=267850 RepID=A0A063Y7K5_9GAMM|nr:hypothetical protein ADINL_0400 [Nitrincola lacisaponensis]
MRLTDVPVGFKQGVTVWSSDLLKQSSFQFNPPAYHSIFSQRLAAS